MVSPREGDVFPAASPVTFTGGGYSPDGGACGPHEVAWHSSLDGLLGTGYQVVRDDLRPGMHRITLSMPNESRGEATASVWIRILDEGETPEACRQGTRMR